MRLSQIPFVLAAGSAVLPCVRAWGAVGKHGRARLTFRMSITLL